MSFDTDPAEERLPLDECIDEIKRLQAKLKIAVDGIEDLFMNTSTAMPAAWNDELSWYSRQLSSCIGRAARLHAKIKDMG